MGRLAETLKLNLSLNPLETASTYILSRLKDYHVNIDEDRNIYVTKGEMAYPAFVVSIDKKDFHDENVIVERIVKNVWVGYEGHTKIIPSEFAAGTKTAIYLGLKLLEKLDNAKCVFKVSNNVSKMFFEDCRWALELNGKGSTEIVTAYAAVPQCSNTFKVFLKTIGKKYGFDVSGSGIPPVSDLGLPISVANIPNGHYAPYSGFHQVVEGDVTKALHFCMDVARMISNVCRIDSGCGTCGVRLTLSEEYFCWSCLSGLRKTKMFCTQCGSSLFTGKEFYAKQCVKCKVA